MTKNLVLPGDQFAEKGTQAWADWQRSRLCHAIKDVHFEAKQIVGVIREMCAGEHPAWHLMTRPEGRGFRTFEEFVTAIPQEGGLGYPDYVKFRTIAISDRTILNEREYDLLTAIPGPTPQEAGQRKGCAPGAHPSRRVKGLRAINRAPALVGRLYVAGLIDAKLAECLGPDKDAPGYAGRKEKADRAVAAIKGLSRNGDDADYRRSVNEAVRRVFGKKERTPREWLEHWWGKATAATRRAFRRWIEENP